MEESGKPVAAADSSLYLLGSFKKGKSGFGLSPSGANGANSTQWGPNLESGAASESGSFDFFGVNSAEAYMTLSRLPAAAMLSGDYSNMEIYCNDDSGAAAGASSIRRGGGGGGKGVRLHKHSRSDILQKGSIAANQAPAGDRALSDKMPSHEHNSRILHDESAASAASAAQAAKGVWKRLKDCPSPHALFKPIITEPSLHFDARSQLWIATSLQINEYAIKLCRSARLVGPWACDFVATVPSPWDSKRFIAYAGKAHPELHAAGDNFEVTLSYVPNPLKGPGALFDEDMRLAYTPKFIALEHTSSS